MSSKSQSNPILATAPLGFPWPTRDPFLFCAHHDDHYPAGNPRLGPAASLSGRDLGQDFVIKDGWRMYHGEVVPGFPQHPHRGFETVTLVRRGLVDHSDSLGATARYGEGDVQWLTAGAGIQHAEMFPLVHEDRPNPLELFQIWLNLPKSHKMVDPYFSMFWANSVPRQTITDDRGKKTEVLVVAGAFGSATPPRPPPDSWAASPDHDVAIWTLKLEPGARFALPQAAPTSNRTIYVFSGSGLEVDSRPIPAGHLAELAANQAVTLSARGEVVELLLLQGRPIGEPVAQSGPFVMNTREELAQTFRDYQRTQFGGWPWPQPDHVHAQKEGRFARHLDGRTERPT